MTPRGKVVDASGPARRVDYSDPLSGTGTGLGACFLDHLSVSVVFLEAIIEVNLHVVARVLGVIPEVERFLLIRDRAVCYFDLSGLVSFPCLLGLGEPLRVFVSSLVHARAVSSAGPGVDRRYDTREGVRGVLESGSSLADAVIKSHSFSVLKAQLDIITEETVEEPDGSFALFFTHLAGGTSSDLFPDVRSIFLANRGKAMLGSKSTTKPVLTENTFRFLP